MSRISLNELHEEILQKLTQRDFLKKISTTEEKMQSLILNKTFITKLSILVNKENITCEDVRELSSEILSTYCGELPKDWLKYVYTFILFRSFPELISIRLNPKYEYAVIIYLEILRAVFLYVEKTENDDYCFNTYLLSDTDEYKDVKEFQEFRYIYFDKYIFELIKLNYELTNSDKYFRMQGIFKFSMQIANKLKKSNVDVKSWMICCALIGKFIGSYAVEESDGISDAAIDYSSEWFEKFGLKSIGNMAANINILGFSEGHLPLEALILTYSDIRVDIKGSGRINYCSIEQISDKLLSCAGNKERLGLYIDKIKDFEGYLASYDVDIKFADANIKSINKNRAFLQGNDIINYFKTISINNNIMVMRLLCDDSSFDHIIELAKATKNWKDIIICLNIFDEYTLYIDKSKKLKLIDFLYGQLNNKDGEIRKLAAKLLGKIAACYENTKQILWKKFLNLIIFSSDIEDREKAIFYLQDFIESFINNTPKEEAYIYIGLLLECFDAIGDNEEAILMLLTALPCIGMNLFNPEQLNLVFDNIFYYLTNNSDDIKLASLDYIYTIIQNEKLPGDINSKVLEHVKDLNMDDKMGINFLKFKILLCLNRDIQLISKYNEFMSQKSKRISEIFLLNLKAATSWIEIIINIDFILDIVKNSNDVVLLHTAAHLCNLVKVSAKEVVRNKAGNALLNIGSYLTIDQRNEISIELIKGLEIDELEFSKYIPEYLGRFALLLHPKELDECIGEIQRLYRESNAGVSSLALRTLSIMLEHYSEYNNVFEQNSGEYRDRMMKILGSVIAGLANNNEQVRIDTLFLIGSRIFNSDVLNDNDKFIIYKSTAKKILSLLIYKNTGYMDFFNNAISLNFIYKFISCYGINYHNADMPEGNKVAFFCDSFDPFSLEHKKIIKEIKKQGFQVYLDVDEFSWWKKTQPHEIRRKIIDISIADEFNTYLFPEDIRINIANTNDLTRLKTLFAGMDLYVVVGRDTILNSAIYKQKLLKNSIYYLNHIIYTLDEALSDADKAVIEDAKDKIKGNIIDISLEASTERRAIDSEALKYIENIGVNFSQKKEKTTACRRPFKIEIINDISNKMADEIGRYLFMYTDLYENMGEELQKKNINLLVIRENSKSNTLLGFSAFHQIGTAQLYSEFNNIDIANYVRENTSGKIVIIDGIYINPSVKMPEPEQTLLTETLLYSLRNDFTYALYYNSLLNYSSDIIFEILELHGFKRLEVDDLKKNIYAVDMKFPICLTMDMLDYINEPLSSCDSVNNIVIDTRKRLRTALTKLYPNNLVLSLDVQMLQQALVEKCDEVNHDNVCVPVTNVLNGRIIPGIATKSLHIGKTYNYDIRDFEVTKCPFYLSSSSQVDVIKSFEKPIILVDDVMHNCQEIVGIDPLLKSKDVNVQKIIVGILSSNGKDIMQIHDREVDSAYFIPNLRLWLRESMLYPFFGGNTVFTNDELKLNLIPSINHILPYVAPNFEGGASKDDIFDLSMVCLKNAKTIFECLEREYKNIFDKNLTLRGLSDVVRFPRYPVKGEGILYDTNKSISAYIDNDIKNLIRIEKIVKY